MCKEKDVVSIVYVGWIVDDAGNKKVFHSNKDEPLPFDVTLGSEQTIEGLEKALFSMQEDELSVIRIAPKYAFGVGGNQQGFHGAGKPIPGSATLEMRVDVRRVTSELKGKEKEEWMKRPFRERFRAAEEAKSRGNGAFGEGRYREAFRAYSDAIRLLQVSEGTTEEVEEELEEEEEGKKGGKEKKTKTIRVEGEEAERRRRERAPLMIALAGNASLCCMKEDSDDRITEAMDLARIALMECDRGKVEKTKFHFRLAQCYERRGQWEECLQEATLALRGAREGSREKSECGAYVGRVREEVKKRNAKSAKHYQKMFQGMQGVYSEEEGEEEEEGKKKNSDGDGLDHEAKCSICSAVVLKKDLPRHIIKAHTKKPGQDDE